MFTRCYDLLAWLLPRAEKFPRAFRFTVTQRLIDAALDLQEALSEAQSQRAAPRLNALREADAALNHLRIYLRLAHDWRRLNAGQYERHRRRDWTPARRLAEAEHALSRSGRGASGLAPGRRPCWIYARRRAPFRAIRADGTSLRHPQRPRLGPPTVVDGHFRPNPGGSGFPKACTMWETHTKRKPRLLLRLPGSLWLR